MLEHAIDHSPGALVPLWRVKLYVRKAALESLHVSSKKVMKMKKGEAMVEFVLGYALLVW